MTTAPQSNGGWLNWLLGGREKSAEAKAILTQLSGSTELLLPQLGTQARDLRSNDTAKQRSFAAPPRRRGATRNRSSQDIEWTRSNLG